MKKYIFIDGVMKPNPEYQAAQGQIKENTLPVVSSTDDVMEANELLEANHKKELVLTNKTTEKLDKLQTESYRKKINAPADSQPIEELTHIFSKYEVPIGMVSKLFNLKHYRLSFIIDDSGSMDEYSDALMSEAHEQTRRRHDPSGERFKKNEVMTRFEEAEDRLYKMVEILAYIRNQGIKISFLNRHNEIIIQQQEHSPQGFTSYAYAQIAQAFQAPPCHKTPIFTRLQKDFATTTPTMHYLFTDGLPSDRSVDEVCDLISRRNSPEDHPLTLIACTNESDLEWMKRIDEQAPCTAELDDFAQEKKDVGKKQGSYFPFNRGFWLLCQLVAAINPKDFDALDESKPLSRDILSQLMGYELTPESYQVYFSQHPRCYEYQSMYSQLLNQKEINDPIVPTHIRAKKQGQMQYPSAPPVYQQPGQPYPQYPNQRQQINQMPPAYQTQNTQPYSPYQTHNQQMNQMPHSSGYQAQSGQPYAPSQNQVQQMPGSQMSPVYQGQPAPSYPQAQGFFRPAPNEPAAPPSNGQNIYPSNFRP